MTNQTNPTFGSIESQDATAAEKLYVKRLEQYITESPFTNYEKAVSFAKYVPRQALSKFLCKYEIFKHILEVDGSIIECGVRHGGGLMTWAQLSAVFEPVNYTRKIVGFDTFTGFPGLSAGDDKSRSIHARTGGLAVDSYEDLSRAIDLYDANRPLGHMRKVELIKGDAVQTIPQYVTNNPHLVVSLLYLDFDIYEPTKTALEYLFPRMPKGAVIAFDELNNPHWPGETKAALDTLGIGKLAVRRFTFNSYISYAVLE